MDGGRDQAFSRSGLAEDEDGCLRGSDLFRSAEDILDTVTLPENRLMSLFHFGLSTEVNIFSIELVYAPAMIQLRSEQLGIGKQPA